MEGRGAAKRSDCFLQYSEGKAMQMLPKLPGKTFSPHGCNSVRCVYLLFCTFAWTATLYARVSVNSGKLDQISRVSVMGNALNCCDTMVILCPFQHTLRQDDDAP